MSKVTIEKLSPTSRLIIGTEADLMERFEEWADKYLEWNADPCCQRAVLAAYRSALGLKENGDG